MIEMHEGGGRMDHVIGERPEGLTGQIKSVQSRIVSLFAIVVLGGLGTGLLVWYYAHALRRPAYPSTVDGRRVERNATDPALPPLGPIGLPRPTTSLPTAASDSASFPAAPKEVLRASLQDDETPIIVRRAVPAATPASPRMGEGQAAAAGTEEVRRRLSGDAFVSVEVARSVPDGRPAALDAGGLAVSESAPLQSAALQSGEGRAGLATLPHTDAVSPVRASLLPTLRLLLPKGAFIDCTLETAIDSTLPGMTTCVTATDTYGADGTVVLLERGTKLVGETRGQVQQGAARVFVLWTEARTPEGVIVPLDSPGTDELGRSGLPGSVNRHFWQRFGAAILISTIDGGVQAGIQASASPGGAVIYNPQVSGTLTDVLRGTMNIPPTVIKRNGDRIQVLVARDVDFRDVYELRSSVAR